MTISFIIPNYNGLHLLEKNLLQVLASVETYTKGTVEFIISDDNSNDGSYDFLVDFKKKYSTKDRSIQILQHIGEAGFSKNVNFAVNHAKGDILLLLNTDAVPEKNFLTPLLQHFSDEHVFAVGCLEETRDNNHNVQYGRSIGHFKRGFIQHTSRKIDGATTFWVSCGSGAFRKSMWDQLGGLDEIYNPFYWEDIDISYRAVKSGYTILFDAKSIVHHNHEKGAIKSNFSKKTITTIAYRNQCIFMWKNITDPEFVFQHIFWLPYYLIQAMLHTDAAFFSGFLQAMFLLPKIMQLKNQQNKHFILSDKNVLKKQS